MTGVQTCALPICFSLAQSQSRLKIYERYMVPRQERTLQAKVDELKRENHKLKKIQICAINKAQVDITIPEPDELFAEPLHKSIGALTQDFQKRFESGVKIFKDMRN